MITVRAPFTPGPWSIDGLSLVVAPDPKDRQFRVIANCRFNAGANASLIAAAPSMAAYIQKRAAAGDVEAIELWERVNTHSGETL